MLQHMVHVNMFLKNKMSIKSSLQLTLHEVIASPLEIMFQ